MSVTGKSGIGIPILVLHDALGGEITIELKDGCTYTGMLDDVQDNMNCTLKPPLSRTNEEGETSELDMAFVRGSQIRFIVLPQILKEAPYFQRIHIWRKYKGSFLYGGGDKMMALKMAPGMGSGAGMMNGPGMGQGMGMGPRPGPGPPGQIQAFGQQQFAPPSGPGGMHMPISGHPRGPPPWGVPLQMQGAGGPGRVVAAGMAHMPGMPPPHMKGQGMPPMGAPIGTGPPPGYQLPPRMTHRGPPPGYPGGPPPGVGLGQAGQAQPPPPPPPPGPS